jgi:hypothetical protein
VARSTRFSSRKLVAIGVVTLGLVGGSYGVASAATSSSSTATPTATPSASHSTQGSAPPGVTAKNPWGNQRSDETLLTGDTLAKVKAAALAKVGSGSTIVRIETDADGRAAYESHMLKADGTAVTVYVDKSFNVVSVESH